MYTLDDNYSQSLFDKTEEQYTELGRSCNLFKPTPLY